VLLLLSLTSSQPNTIKSNEIRTKFHSKKQINVAPTAEKKVSGREMRMMGYVREERKPEKELARSMMGFSH
jgi:hypothetical protein